MREVMHMNPTTLPTISKLIRQEPKPNATYAELVAWRRQQKMLLALIGGRVRVEAETRKAN